MMRRCNTVLLSRVVVSNFLRDQAEAQPLKKSIKQHDMAGTDAATSFTRDFLHLQKTLFAYRIVKLQAELDEIRANPLSMFPPLFMWPVHLFILFILVQLGRRVGKTTFGSFTLPPTKEKEAAIEA